MSIATTLRRYDRFWSTFNAADLIKMANLWGASSKLPKAERVSYLIAALKDPAVIDAAIAQMRPYERAALDLVKFIGGDVNAVGLAVAVRATGLVPDSEEYQRLHSTDLLAKMLIERGIVMRTTGAAYYSYAYDQSDIPVFVDDRILSRLPPQNDALLSVDTADAPTASTYRRVPSVMLEVISILRAIENLGGIALTKSREMRVNDLRKIARKLGWEEQIEIDGLPFPDPLRAYIAVMTAGGLLSRKADAVVNAAPLEQVVQASATNTLRNLLRGIFLTTDWHEHSEVSSGYGYRRYAPAGRFALIAALRSLPDRTAWYAFADFERALFGRIGESHSVAGLMPQPHTFRKTVEEQRIEREVWRREIRTAWEKYDVPWMQAVFQTWMYAFGLVELHRSAGQVDRFRLTDLGRALLWDEVPEETAESAAPQTPAWIVQPNFEMVVYLDSASTERISFLEQYAERIQVAQHTAQYRLTRDSVYEGLQRGGSVDQLIDGLTSGSRVGLPGNVQAEIRSWAGLRERIVVRQRADLIEFADATEREQAITRGLQGVPVADRFLLLPENYTLAIPTPTVIDYSHPPDRRSLLLTEEGVIIPGKPDLDLLTQGILDIWAERESRFVWKLTRKSVGQAAQRGRKYSELVAFLKERMTLPIPGLLAVALQAWTGSSAQASLATVIFLECPQAGLLDALFNSKSLKPHILRRIGSEGILIKSTDVEAVRAILEWAGIQVSAQTLDL
jgi:hypothetical protein